MGGSWGKGEKRCSFGSDDQSGKQRGSFFLIPSQSSSLPMEVLAVEKRAHLLQWSPPPIPAPLLLSLVHGLVSPAEQAVLVSAGSALAKGCTSEYFEAKERSMGEYIREYKL